jgi:hypothetical protein
VTRSGGIRAQESQDGRFLYYTKTRGITALWKAPLADGALSGPETQVAESIFYLDFDVGAEGVYFKPGRSIQFLPAGGGPIRKVGDVGGQGLSVSPDRRFFLYSVAAGLKSELMLVENFR